MSLYVPFPLAAALGVDTECRNDDAGVVQFGDSPDAGAGGGTADDAAPPDDSAQPQETDVDPTRAADAAVDDDEVDDPDLRDDAHRDKPWANDPEFKRALNRGRRAQRWRAANRDLVNKVRAFGIADNLDDVVHRSRAYDSLAQQRQPQGRATGSRADGSADEWKPPAFDRTKHPFAPDDPGTAWLLDQAEQGHNNYWGLVEVMRGMARELKDLQEGYRGEQESRMTGAWRSELDTAAVRLPERTADGVPLRQLFRDAVIGAYQQARIRRNDPRAAQLLRNPKAAVAHYLKDFKPASKVASSEAAKQRIAVANQNRPSAAAFRGGTPSSARDISNERVSDASRRLLGNRYFGRR